VNVPCQLGRPAPVGEVARSPYADAKLGVKAEWLISAGWTDRRPPRGPAKARKNGTSVLPPAVGRRGHGKMSSMPATSYPDADAGEALQHVTHRLDPVLRPLGFAPGQIGADGSRGQVVFCRGLVDPVDDGCVDLVLDVEATPERRVVDVPSWGYPADRWHLDFDQEPLVEQLRGLAQSLPTELA
jgi:hypothetical protein